MALFCSSFMLLSLDIPFYEFFFHRLQKHTHMSVPNALVPGLVVKYQE
jgi:hypothetical protein